LWPRAAAGRGDARFHGVPPLALLAACATVPREPTPGSGAWSARDESFVLHPRDGGSLTDLGRLPLSYARAPERRYPVVYSLDGDVGFAMCAGITRFLAFAREMPEVLVVAVGYGDDLDHWRARRVGDLTPVAVASRPGSGKAERYLGFLASDVLPLVDRRYRTAPDRTLSGYSLGGLFSTYVLFHRPGLFQRYLIGSPSYLYADGAALRWPEAIRGEGARPSGIVATSVGKSEAPAQIAAWRDFWDEVERRRPPELQLLRVEIDETHAAGAWVGLVKGLKAVFSISPPAVSSEEN
jgi:hypothetical protein